MSGSLRKRRSAPIGEVVGMAKKERAGFVLYFADLAALAEVMDDASVGRLVLALSAYAQDGTEPHFADTGLQMAFGLLRAKVDRDREHYLEISEARAAAARRRAEEKERLLQMLQMQPNGKGAGAGNGNGYGGGNGKGMSVDPRIVELERLKAKYAEEENEL